MLLLLSLLPFALVFAGAAWRDRAKLRARRRQFSLRRRIAGIRPEDHGLVPRAELDRGSAGPPSSPDLNARVQGIADAAWAGDWQPAAAYVAEAGQDWDERWERLELLRQIARKDDAWLEKWRADQPDNGDAATAQAAVLVHRAWQRRGSGWASQVSTQARQDFKSLLPAGVAAARAAAELAPEDPAPWVVLVMAARGMGNAPQQFQPLWEELYARAPLHCEGHWQALQFWCAKWHGSDRLMMAFAEATLDRVPSGSPVAGIYLHALHELETRGELLPRGRRAVERLHQVRSALAEVPADHERLPVLRHLLAHYLLQAKQYGAALEQFRLIGRWCGASPWTDQGHAVTAFDNARLLAAARAE